MSHAIRPRRLFVSGGSRLSTNAATLWRELGGLLATEDGLVVITGGLAGFKDDPSAISADLSIVEGLRTALQDRNGDLEQHIETVLPDATKDHRRLLRFKEGRICILRKRNSQSRRFSMVQSADVVVSIEGAKGTSGVLDMALAIERPILPLPFGGGESEKVWRAHREDICSWFQIDSAEADAFEQIDLRNLRGQQIKELAAQVHVYLMRGFSQGCFVIMRFHRETDPVYEKAIEPALTSKGFQPWRTDRTVASGDVVEAIRDGIRHCYFAIADTTGDRPNVMYELGFAHAIGKPIILLRRADPDGTMHPAPFDFQTQSILTYTNDLEDLRKRLEVAIAMVAGKS